MKRVAFVIPPSNPKIIRDVPYGCWHEQKDADYMWPPIELYQYHAIIPNSIVIDAQALDMDEDDVADYLDREKIDVVVMSVGPSTVSDDIFFIEYLRKYIEAEFVAVGLEPTVHPEDIHRYFDYFIRGEPEVALKEMILNNKIIKGVGVKGKIPKVRAPIPELDSLPHAKRDLVKYKNPFAVKKRWTTMLVGRGCNGSCSFCSVPIYHGKYRRRSLKNVTEELTELKKQGYEEIFFRDESISSDSEFLKRLSEELSKLNFVWMCNAKIDQLDEDLIKKMAESGCHLIKFGIESHDPKVRKKLGKDLKEDHIKLILKACKKNRIDALLHFIIGLKNQDIDATYKYAKGLNTPYVSFDIYRNNHQFYNRDLNVVHDRLFKKFYRHPKTMLKHLTNVKSFVQLKNKIKATLR